MSAKVGIRQILYLKNVGKPCRLCCFIESEGFSKAVVNPISRRSHEIFTKEQQHKTRIRSVFSTEWAVGNCPRRRYTSLPFPLSPLPRVINPHNTTLEFPPKAKATKEEIKGGNGAEILAAPDRYGKDKDGGYQKIWIWVIKSGSPSKRFWGAAILLCFSSGKRRGLEFFEEFLREKAHSVKQIVHDGLLVLGLPPPPLTHSRQEGKQNAADRSIGRKTDRRRKGICQISKNKKIKNLK